MGKELLRRSSSWKRDGQSCAIPFLCAYERRVAYSRGNLSSRPPQRDGSLSPRPPQRDRSKTSLSTASLMMIEVYRILLPFLAFFWGSCCWSTALARFFSFGTSRISTQISPGDVPRYVGHEFGGPILCYALYGAVQVFEGMCICQ
jgi:hypothetical protein